MVTTEDRALKLWREWGWAWAFYGRCSACREMKLVRGRTKRKLLCLDCFDSQ